MSEIDYVTNFDSKLFVTATIALNLERVEAVQIADRDEKRIVVSTEGSAVSRTHLGFKGEDALQFLKHYFAFCGQNVPKHFLDVFGVDMFGARIVEVEK